MNSSATLSVLHCQVLFSQGWMALSCFYTNYSSLGRKPNNVNYALSSTAKVVFQYFSSIDNFEGSLDLNQRQSFQFMTSELTGYICRLQNLEQKKHQNINHDLNTAHIELANVVSSENGLFQYRSTISQPSDIKS